jgi:dinuclear metal center YbgI/SA1388 family protein
MQTSDLNRYLDRLLDTGRIKDYCPNGLQVEGRSEIKKLVGGVTASQAFLDAALDSGADAVLVHHGYFWKGEAEVITGIKKRRLQSLLVNDLNLFAYHLPLDVHSEFGNNIQLAKLLGFDVVGGLEPNNPKSVGLYGQLKTPMTVVELNAEITRTLGRESMFIADPKKVISTIAWCTGAAQGMIDKAIDLGVDAYLSGEISEPTVHIAREAEIAYFSAGHHATERYGVQALGLHIAEQFGVEFEFIDIDNPV